MSSQADIDDAILDLRDQISKGFTPELLESVASDWDIHPQLLHRKFTERMGAAPDAYAAVDPDAMNLSVTLAAMRSDHLLFSLRHRVMQVTCDPSPAWTYISGMLVQDRTGRKIVLRCLQDKIAHYMVLGSTTDNRLSIDSLFGSREEMRKKVTEAPQSRLQPSGFDPTSGNGCAKSG